MTMPKLDAAQHLGYSSKIGDFFFQEERIFIGKKKMRRKSEDHGMCSIDLQTGFAKQGEKERSLIHSVYGY